MANLYHEPEPFRYSLGAWIQAARSVTFMLQKEEAAFGDFSWYHEWAAAAGAIQSLAWLNKQRASIVHKAALMPASWVEFRCVRRRSDPYYDPDHDIEHFLLSPFECTHSFMAVGELAMEDRHPHLVVRHWEIDGMRGREVLELTAEIFDHLRLLVADAHKKAGGRPVTSSADNEPNLWIPGRLPCMEKLERFQTARFSVRDGRTVWANEPPELKAHRKRQAMELKAAQGTPR